MTQIFWKIFRNRMRKQARPKGEVLASVYPICNVLQFLRSILWCLAADFSGEQLALPGQRHIKFPLTRFRPVTLSILFELKYSIMFLETTGGSATTLSLYLDIT